MPGKVTSAGGARCRVGRSASPVGSRRPRARIGLLFLLCFAAGQSARASSERQDALARGKHSWAAISRARNLGAHGYLFGRPTESTLAPLLRARLRWTLAPLPEHHMIIRAPGDPVCVSCLQLTRHQSEIKEAIYLLTNVATSESHVRRGLASTLLGIATALADEANAPSILRVERRNVEAQSVYRSCGFSGLRELWLWDLPVLRPRPGDLLMRRSPRSSPSRQFLHVAHAWQELEPGETL